MVTTGLSNRPIALQFAECRGIEWADLERQSGWKYGRRGDYFFVIARNVV